MFCFGKIVSPVLATYALTGLLINSAYAQLATYDPGTSILALPVVTLDNGSQFTNVSVHVKQFGDIAFNAGLFSRIDYTTTDQAIKLQQVTVDGTTYNNVRAVLAQFDMLQGNPVSASNTQYSYLTPKVGDFYTYSETDLLADNSASTFVFTRKVTGLNSDGSYSLNQLNESNVVTRTENRSSDGFRLSRTFTSNNNVCSYAPKQAYWSYPVFVGKTFTSTWTYSCSAGYHENVTLTGSVLGIESVTTSAGTFNALKINYAMVFSGANDTNLASGRYTINETNWWSPELGKSVKWMDIYTYFPTDTVPANYIRRSSAELTAYKKQ